MNMGFLVNRLGLLVAAALAGIGKNAFLLFGGLLGYLAVIKVVLIRLSAVANRTSGLVSIIVNRLPCSPLVSAVILGAAPLVLAMANVGLCAIVDPIAPIMIESRYGLGLLRTASATDI